ncbi:prenyltransferase/squalene oxidase repeat-containing protein [Nocardioides renjunii]|uniref:hypothetical protein n=1 Tax=Nocardioides renjunii TaxID=3095075 RepID=UPI002AFE6BBD|nr:hypothetical protein [Nocardioides sp. S-34]WQQ21130.1 hypothetical protein SHK17_14620 [Nocardioides sp. S-34]
MKLTSGLAVVALAAATLAPSAAAAAPVPPTQLVTDWIGTQLTDGVALGSFGADVGLSIDAGLALDATGRSADAARVADAIAGRLVSSPTNPYGYVQSDEYDSDPPYDFTQIGYYANATAKAAAFTQRIGRDAATAYAAVNLVDQLEDLTDDTTGVVGDDSSFGDYANTIGQAFAAEALTVAGSPEASDATAALLAQQCPAGYFRFDLDAAACAADATGVAPDTTGLAVLSLLESGNTSPEVTAAIAEATAWLESVQRADGSLEGDSSTPGANSNSTGLAGWALGRAGRQASAAKAAAWVRSLQVADAGACASRAPTGAIAYNAADLTAARVDGIAGNATVRDTWRRASFQAAPALLWAPAASTSLGVSAPVTAVEKSTVTVTVRGVAAGEQACVSFGSDARRVVGTGSDLAVAFTLPAGAAAHTFTVATLGGTTTATTSATAVPAVPPAVPPAAPMVGDLDVSRTEKVRKNRFKVDLTCESAQPCFGKLTVSTAGKVRLGKAKKVVTVARRSYAIAPGAEKKLVLTLTKPARKLLARGTVKVKAVQTASGARRAVTTFRLKAAKG